MLLTYRLSLILLFLPFTVYGQTPAPSLSPTPPVVLDDHQITESDDTIKRAGQQGDVETLLLALHKGVRLQTCLDQIHLLPRNKKVQVLLGMLDDEQILPPVRFEGYDPPGSTTLETIMPREVETMTYELLGELPPKYHGMLTRKQMDALTVKLHTLQ